MLHRGYYLVVVLYQLLEFETFSLRRWHLALIILVATLFLYSFLWLVHLALLLLTTGFSIVEFYGDSFLLPTFLSHFVVLCFAIR